MSDDVKMRQPYRYGDLVSIKSRNMDSAVVISYSLSYRDDKSRPIDFEYTVARLSDGQEESWFSHDDLILVEEGSKRSLEAARAAYKKFMGRIVAAKERGAYRV